MFCKHCASEKLESDFYACNKAKCKECIKASVRLHRSENLSRIREYDRLRASQPHRVANNFKQSQSWRREFPNRARAQSAVQYALKKGRLKKLPCLVCGEKAVAHHPDYDRPLDVVWLCQSHHKQTHALVESE